MCSRERRAWSHGGAVDEVEPGDSGDHVRRRLFLLLNLFEDGRAREQELGPLARSVSHAPTAPDVHFAPTNNQLNAPEPSAAARTGQAKDGAPPCGS